MKLIYRKHVPPFRLTIPQIIKQVSNSNNITNTLQPYLLHSVIEDGDSLDETVADFSCVSR